MTYDSEITNEVSSFCGQVKQITMAIKIGLYGAYNFIFHHIRVFSALNILGHTEYTYKKYVYLWKVAGNSKLPYS